MPTSTELDALDKAVAEFNSWRFYDCHETLEDVWREVGGKTESEGYARLYQGIIKAAAGFHHVLRGNYKGAVNLLTDSVRLLAPYRREALGLDIERLLADVRASLERIEELGPGQLRQFDRALIPSIHPSIPQGERDGT